MKKWTTRRDGCPLGLLASEALDCPHRMEGQKLVDGAYGRPAAFAWGRDGGQSVT